MIKMLITGGTGFVGRNLAEYFLRRCTVCIASRRPPADDAPPVPWRQMDIRDRGATLAAVREIAPDVIIHAAGNKDVRYCENNPEEAFAVNAAGTGNVACAAREVAAKMVYLSTDLIFAGTRGQYGELDIPHSSLSYGRAKYLGESLAIQEHEDLVICRTGGLYGKYSPLLKWLGGELSQGREVACFTDVHNTPTYVVDLAESIAHLIRSGAGGIFHTIGRQRVNRHEFFLAYARAMGHDDSLLKAATLGDKRMEMLLMPDCSLSSEITFRRLGLRFKSPQEGFEAMGKAPADALEGVAALQIGKDRMNGQALPTTQDDPDR